MFYEVLAFVIVYSLLYLVFKVVLMLTGLIEKILKATVYLVFLQKILGIFVGIIEMYVYVFLILVVITLPIINIPYIRDSKIANFMLDKTPILSKVSEEMVDTIWWRLQNSKMEKDNKNNEELNDEVIKLLLDKKVITKESLSKLIDRNKIHIKDESILD